MIMTTERLWWQIHLSAELRIIVPTASACCKSTGAYCYLISRTITISLYREISAPNIYVYKTLTFDPPAVELVTFNPLLIDLF